MPKGLTPKQRRDEVIFSAKVNAQKKLRKLDGTVNKRQADAVLKEFSVKVKQAMKVDKARNEERMRVGKAKLSDTSKKLEKRKRPDFSAHQPVRFSSNVEDRRFKKGKNYTFPH